MKISVKLINLIKRCAIFLVLFFLIFLNTKVVYAQQTYGTYTSPDGFKVVSYTSAWSDTAKLKSVYDELLRNAHGEELKLLRRINIYPGPDPSGEVAGRWYGQWQIKSGVPVLSPNRYIDIYDGSRLTEISDIARTLSHEYGHHFTYYYYFKKERRSWDNWKSSGLAAARNLKYNSKVGFNNVAHKWLIQEIAAEDYVQLFGSPNAKQNQDFKDISERMSSQSGNLKFDTNIFNYHPQENFELPLAANLPALRQYWTSVSGIQSSKSLPPSPVTPSLVNVTFLDEINKPQYKFEWSKGTDDKSNKLTYTLVWFDLSKNNYFRFFPIKTCTDEESLTAYFGSAINSLMYSWEEIPSKVGYFVVYVQDDDLNITSSRILAVDFSNKLNPDTVLMNDNSLSTGSWFSPTVKVNGEQLNFDVPPVITQGRTMVPVRTIFEKLGAEVNWNPVNKTIRAVKGNSAILLTIGSSTAYVNGKTVTLDAPAQIIQNRTLVPLRFISESFGADVNWNPNLQLVKIAQ